MKQISIVKRVIFSLAVSLSALFFYYPLASHGPALAATPKECEAQKKDFCFGSCVDKGTCSIKLDDPFGGAGPKTIDELIDKVVDLLSTISFAVAPLLYMYAAYLYLISGTVPDKKKQANQIMIWTSVGIVALLVARSIPDLIRDIIR